MKPTENGKTVLWISRHPMTPEQISDLERIMGGAVRLQCWTDTVEDVEALRPAVRQADAVAAVLPMEKLAQLRQLAGEKPVLQAAALRIPTGKELVRPDGQKEKEFAFVHQGWKQVLRVSIETKLL